MTLRDGQGVSPGDRARWRDPRCHRTHLSRGARGVPRHGRRRARVRHRRRAERVAARRCRPTRYPGGRRRGNRHRLRLAQAGQLLSAFFSATAPAATSAEMLADGLARRATLLRFRVRITDVSTQTTKDFQLDYVGAQVTYTP